MTPVETVERVIRTERTRMLATMIRLLGDLDLAEDCLQEATVRALETWPRDGVPPQPRAWLLTTARNRAIDRFRREGMRTERELEAARAAFPSGQQVSDSVVRDDLLRLFFTCCHPSLSTESQVALTLRTLGGLTTAETARALLATEASMAKRLARAKQKIACARIPYRVPGDGELPGRLAAVLATIYLMFNEGYAAGSGGDVIRPLLVDEAIRLGRLLQELMPDEVSVAGLLALMVLHDARRPARVDATGSVVTLADQDRRLWRHDLVAEGVDLVAWALRRSGDVPEYYTVQAAIAGCHALAASYDQTDWSAIISWYDVLRSLDDSPVMRLNRAAAVAERDGPAAALTSVDALQDELAGYAWWHASRAELLRRLDRDDDAAKAARRASELGLNDAHARFLLREAGPSGAASAGAGRPGPVSGSD